MQQHAPNPASEPLSVAQQRLWILEQLHPGSAIHNLALGLRSSRRIEPALLETAWRAVLQRHEVLRTQFHTVDASLVRVVTSTTRVPLKIVSLRNLRQPEHAAGLSSLVEQEIETRFDLAEAPLLRCTLFELPETEQALVVVAHRLICDAVSMNILLAELFALCESPGNGGCSSQLELPRQYREVATPPVPANELSYWAQKLAGAPASVDLPTDHPRPPIQTFRGAKQRMRISAVLAQQLGNLAQRQGGTLFEVLLAAFAVLLSRYARQDDLVIGTRVSGRDRPERERVVGPLENWLALRIDSSGDPSFRELLIRVREVLGGALRHKSVPFEALMRELHPERDMSRHPLFQIMLAMQNTHTAFEPGRAASLVAVDGAAEQFDLSVEFAEREDGLEAVFGYGSDLFDTATITRMMDHLGILLESAVRDPAVHLASMPMLTETERHQLLAEWNHTRVPYPGVECLHEFFEEQVKRTGNAVAVTHRGRSLTYDELNQRANRVAHYLRRLGVEPDALVGICIDRSLEMMVGILGILKAGGAYVPLDPGYPKDRLAVILEDAKAQILVTQEKLVGLLPSQSTRLVRLDADWPQIALEPATNPPLATRRSNLDYVLFTSGSTGRPKGVALEHRSAVIFVHWAQQVFLPEEVAGTLLSTSICFDLSVFEMFVPLSMGGTVIIVQNALELPELKEASDVTLINTVPSAIAALIRMNGVPPSVRVVCLAGEALLSSLAEQIYHETGVPKVYNLYGPTEDTTYSTFTLVPRGGEVTIGKPLLNTQVYILDGNRQLVPIGVPGELYLAGDGLARGYFGREDLTNERFVPNLFSSESGARMYRTGDLARFLANGEIEYLGRIDNQVKVRGFRIELEEIETVLDQHPSVESAVVIAREDDPGDKRLVAYVVPAGTSISTTTLQDALRRRLPEYMVPSVFVELKQLPLSPNGKVNRRLLPAPEQSLQNHSSLVAARDELEATLVNIWRKVLGVNNVGIHDDFFNLGGHSLTAARLLTEVQRATGEALPLSALFRGATVDALARLIREQSRREDPLVMEIQRGISDRLPFFAVVPPGEESLGYAMLARHMGPEQTVYKIQGHAPVIRSQRPYTEQEMVALTGEYIAAMRAVQPNGPYCLGGLCDGTHIAEQIVLRLEAQGSEVGLFAIFDTWVLQHSQNRWLWKIHYYQQRLREMKNLSVLQRVAWWKRVAGNKVQTLVGAKSARVDWRQTYWPENFTAARFRAPVILFKRPKQPFYYANDPLMGWGARTESRVEIHEVDFRHFEILREPHVAVFGKELAERVARVSTTSKPLGLNHPTSLVEAAPGHPHS